jgi:hypothetical protein
MTQEQPTPPEPTPASPAPQKKPSSLQQVRQVWQTVQPVLVKLWETTLHWAKQAKAFWDTTQPKVQRWWEATLPRIRGILPQAWNEKLTDWMITSGAIALVVLLFWLTTSLLFPHRVVAKAPPAAATPVAKVTPIDPGKLTSIQNQLNETAVTYGEALVDAVRVQPQRQRLTVQVSDSWYGLSATQQDQLANDWFKRSLKLKYSQLDLVDAAGQMLARSPVVGSKMVVLQRSLAVARSNTATE